MKYLNKKKNANIVDMRYESLKYALKYTDKKVNICIYFIDIFQICIY